MCPLSRITARTVGCSHRACPGRKMQPRFVKIWPRTHLQNVSLQWSLDFLYLDIKKYTKPGSGNVCICRGDERWQEVKPAKLHLQNHLFKTGGRMDACPVLKESFGMWGSVGSCRCDCIIGIGAFSNWAPLGTKSLNVCLSSFHCVISAR